MREIIKTSKTSTLIDNIEKSLKDIKHNIDKITKDRQHNRQIFQDQIKKMHDKISSHFDTLEHNILQELDDTEDKIKSKMYKLCYDNFLRIQRP